MKRRFFIILVAALLLCPALAWAQTSCSAASSGTAPTGVTNGQFTTQNGQIIGPNGRPFVPRGVDVLWGDNPSLAQIEALAPGTNMIRLAVYQPFPSAASMASYVNSLTAAGIVVEIGDYSSSLGTNEGGGKDYIFNGQMLANEQAFYTDLGNTFKYNPYVWTGTDNEPSDVVQATNQASMSALGDWQQQTIDTIRATGDTAPILVDPWGGGDPASPTSGIALSATQAATDSNIIWDPHGYGWVATGYSQNQATVNQAIASLIAGARSVKTADGTAAVMIGEYGNATDGVHIDPNANELINAVQSSGVGSTAWAWESWPADGLLNGSGGLSPYGQQIAAYVAGSGATGCPVSTIAVPTPSAAPTDAQVAVTAATNLAAADVASPASANSISIVPNAVDTDPIDTTATSGGAQPAGVAGATNAIPEPMGPMPTTVASIDPIVSAPAASGTEQVIPTYGINGAGNSVQSAAAASPTSSSNPSGDPIFSSASGTPQQVVPKYGTSNASGGVTNVSAGQTDSGSDVTDSTSSLTSTGSTTASVLDPADTRQLQTMMAQSYGQSAVTTADQLGVNAASVAAIAQVESNFQNVGTANGSTTATGPWQFTQGTFLEVSQSNNLGFSSSDLTNPNAQATEAPYYLQQIASTIGADTGQPATTLQAYGGWVFGPDAGTQIANASSSTPLSSVVSAQSLANNGMSNWTVGDFRTAMTARLGAAANQTVLTTQGI